jgi:predicted outer membrane protein
VVASADWQPREEYLCNLLGRTSWGDGSALQGPEFDAVFANLQVAVQTAAVHQFSAYSQNGTSGPLRRYAKLMLPTSKMFLEYAHRLAASR